MGKKNPSPPQKKRRGNTRTTQQPPLLPEEVKHIAPMDVLGTSGTVKAMEPWCEGWLLYSSSADGGNNVEHTHHDCKQKMQFALRPLASGIKMTILLPAPPATKLKPAIPLESGHLGPTTFFACNHNGVGPTSQLQEVGKHMLVDQIRLCVRYLRLCTRIRVPRTSVTDVLRKQLFQLSNKSFVVHQPTLCALWVRLGHLEKLPTDEHVWTGIITCGGARRGSGLQGLWRGLKALHCLPILGTSSELEAGKARNSPTVGTEEEAAMLPLGSERGSSSSKRRGELDGGGDSGLEVGAGGDSPGFQQVTSSSHPFSGMVPGTWTERSALMMCSASLMNPFSKGVTTTSSKLPLWLATSSQRCSD